MEAKPSGRHGEAHNRPAPGGARLGALIEAFSQGFEMARPAAKARRKPGGHATGAHRPPVKGRAKPDRQPVSRAKPAGGKLDALGWFLAALVILAWPRSRSLFDWSFLKTGAVLAADEAVAADLAEPGRGRAAANPAQIPWRGWKDIIWRAWTDFNRDNIPQVAGGVAFFGLLAVFPAIAAFVSLYGLFSNVATAEAQLQILSGVIPKDALSLVGDQMIRIAAARHSGLGIAFAVSLLLSVWSANAGVKALIVGLNVAFEEKEKRNLVRLNLVSLGITLGALVFVMLALAAVIVAPVVVAFVGYKGAALSLLRWPFLLAMAVGGLGVLYRFAPSRRQGKWKWVSWGSALSALLWLAASLLFSLYVTNFGSYDKTYGSLGAVVGFMTWIWISTITVLFGAELNSEIEHQTAVDTTTGHPKPMGHRGAHVADTLGEARPRSLARA